MTTSFNTSDEFDPQDEDFGEGGDFPVAFGITFTPQVTGIAIGVGGFLIAGYLFWSQVLPVWNELSELNKQKQEKQSQLEQLNSSKLDLVIAKKQNELTEAKDLKEDVLKLFATDQTLDTLLLDVNSFTNFSNIKMNTFVPTLERQTVADESFGSLATNNLQVKSYSIDLEGSFNQLQLFLQDLERLQPLLVVKNLNTSTINPPQYLLENNQLITIEQPKLKTTITLQAVFPQIQPPAPAPEGEKPPEGQKPPEGEAPAK
ncbi:type IV pilus biogenesis protein PilO [Geminocystis sp. NIES-3708]|uniref:type II and III secretion system protein n=1 Tax=Geminocystis sp. NIES-3708 TaxID=1615909 RepID=UPI0005FCD8B9|nr:type II and III secretion system protein [Geminocystis sp. NIES-3708]BAQ59663.1 type IV pilus biogenesis protein PilO [Geminocystis sp. NIES-3708]